MERTALRSVTIGFNIPDGGDREKAIEVQAALAKAGIRPTSNYYGTNTKRPEDWRYESEIKEKTKTVVVFPLEGGRFDFGYHLNKVEKDALTALLKSVGKWHRGLKALELTTETITTESKPSPRGTSVSVWVDWNEVEWGSDFSNRLKRPTGWRVECWEIGDAASGYPVEVGPEPNHRLFTFRVASAITTNKKVQLRFSLSTDREASLLDGVEATHMVGCLTALFRKVCSGCGLADFYASCESTLKAEKKGECDISWLLPPPPPTIITEEELEGDA